MLGNYSAKKEKLGRGDVRLKVTAVIFVLLAAWIIFRLAVLMIVNHSFYEAMSVNAHEVVSQLVPKRGAIYIQDSRSGEKFPLAMNQDYFLLYADTREIKDEQTAENVAKQLSEIFNYHGEQTTTLFAKLNRRTAAYVPIEKKVVEETMHKIDDLKLPGIYFVRVPFRYYPEGNLASNIVGFLGKDEKGNNVGRYGIESYWQKDLAGVGGNFSGAQGAAGGLIPLAPWSMKPAQDGVNLLLTIDRTLQYQSCKRLEETMHLYGAISASLILMDSQTGAIRVMCSLPDFDPNYYGQVSSTQAYNNNNIFTPYEPGSVFKAITMAAALDDGVVTPDSTFVDPGQRADLCKTPIKNAMGKTYGLQNMSGILENSINTGIVYVEEKMGKLKFKDYVNNFGFGLKEGVELDTEVSGNITTLELKKGDKVDCYAATAAFGQGITATPLQLITAFGALANGGELLKPYVVEEINYTDGSSKKTQPKEIRRVIDNRSAKLVNAMLINVVDKIDKKAQVKGYYIGGKTGTAQIPVPGGYSDQANHTFIGMVPADLPKFVMLIKLEKPDAAWAESTVAPLFGELADFILKYYQIPPTR